MDVKISTLVASTATYARKAATAADTNKDGKLTKLDAKKLPKDLRDDFARQGKGKTSVTVAKFASDQAAYVARAAKAADANHDGVLSATEQATLPASLADNLKNFTAAGGDKLGGVAYKQLAPSAALEAKVSAALGQTTNFTAQFKLKPSDVAKMIANPQAHKDFFNDLLFKATGTDYQSAAPTYYTPDGLTLGTTTQPAAVADVVANLTEAGTDVPAFTAQVKAMVTAVAGSGGTLFRLGWSNQDDASFDGVFSLDAKTGMIRAAGWMNEP